MTEPSINSGYGNMSHEVFLRYEASRPVAVGDVLHGFCGGAFGRDHYECSRVEAIGSDWLVVRPMHKLYQRYVNFASGDDILVRLREYRTPVADCSCQDEV